MVAKRCGSYYYGCMEVAPGCIQLHCHIGRTQTHKQDTTSYRTDADTNMDIEEFVKTVPPGKKTSRLNKYANEIRQLKSKGYTDEQIREWLGRNGIEISREAVRRFVKKTNANQTTGIAEKPEPDKIEQTANNTQTESQAEKLKKRLAEQQSEAEKARFKHDKSGNIK